MENVKKFSNFIDIRLSSCLDPEFPQGSPTPLYKKHYRTSSGIDIQFGPIFPVRKKKKSIQEQLEEDQYIYQPSYYALRIEYNPNNITLSEIRPIFSSVKNFSLNNTIYVSRVDTAIDYKASLNPELILCRGIKKNCVFGGKKGVETVYFGRRTSKNFFRIYNKRQEIIDSGSPDPNHDIWRIELEYSNSFPLSTTPDLGPQFDKLIILPGSVISSENDWIFNMILENSVYSGSLENTLNKIPLSTRKRYIQKISDYSSSLSTIEDPSSIVRRDFPSAFSRIRVDLFSLFNQRILL